MIYANNICLAYGSQTIFDNLSFNFSQDQRIGLVGRNGSGKSTLLEAINDPSMLDAGSIRIFKGKKIAYMPQEVVLLSDKSILDEAFSGFEQLHTLKQTLAKLEQEMAINPDPDILTAYTTAQEQLSLFNADLALAQTKKMLTGFGFSLQQFDQPVTTLSVGWKMRIVLAKLLLQNADFYLFDEPTNHLDLIAKEWFLDFLKESSFGFMLVCHERYFLNELCDTILELELGKGTVYKGNYSLYETQKEEAMTRLETAYIQQQKDIKRKKETIERFRSKASKATMAQSMIKQLEKIELITLPHSLKSVSFSFPPIVQPGRAVLQVHNVGYAFGNKKIFEHVSFDVEREQKVALIAPNGAGKTTLFNIIAGTLPLQQGKVIFGYNVHHAIFDQDQTRSLNINATVVDNVKQRCPKKSEQVVRTLLGSFLLSGDNVLKKVGVLSGGEKNRVGMICVLLQDANLLLLDEPTNHLDIPSKAILLKALQEYKGTIVFVSHDRDFVNALATHTLELTPHGAHMYHGNYDSYLQQKKDNAPVPTDKIDKAKNDPQLSTAIAQENQFEIRKKSKRLEEKISKLEHDIKEVAESFADLEYGTPDYTTAQQRLQQLQQELRATEKMWEDIQRQLTQP